MGLRSLACGDCGFEFLPGAWMPVCCVWCEVAVSATGWALVQRISTECGVPECDREASIMRRSGPIRGCCSMKWSLLVSILRVPDSILIVVTNLLIWNVWQRFEWAREWSQFLNRPVYKVYLKSSNFRIDPGNMVTACKLHNHRP
jgi:hypothetical protein